LAESGRRNCKYVGADPTKTFHGACPDRAPTGGIERCEKTLTGTIDPFAAGRRQGREVRDGTDLGAPRRSLRNGFAPQGQSVDVQRPIVVETVIAAAPADIYPFCQGSACTCQHIPEPEQGKLIGHRGRQDFDAIEVARS
jgi:hypothetical protein